MSLQSQIVAATALMTVLGLGSMQSAAAAPRSHPSEGQLFSQTPDTNIDAPTETDTDNERLPVRIVRIFGNDYAVVEVLGTGETRQITFTDLGDTREVVPGKYAIITYGDNDEIVDFAIVEEAEAMTLQTELEQETTSSGTVVEESTTSSETVIQSETTVERQTVQQSTPAPAPAPEPVRALW